MMRRLGLFGPALAVLLGVAPVFAALPGGANAPGSILSSSPMSAPAGALAWHVTYQSRGLHGEPIVVSGVVIAPAKRGTNRGVIAWAHPTTGVAESCAPSGNPNFFNTIPHLSDLVARGYVVAATDYPGLGSPGVHPYLVGTSEARAVIDAVRAARNIPQAGAGARYVAWGHSQGAHAALFVGEIARAYAPELSLAGIAAISPPTQLAPILREDLALPAGRILTGYAVYSWSKNFSIPLDTALRLRTAVPVVNAMARTCAQTKGEGYALSFDAALTTQRLIKPTIYTTAPWAGLFSANSPVPAPFPYFVAQGTADTIVPPSLTAGFVAQLCRAGRPVTFDRLEGQGHNGAAFLSAPQAVDWMSARLKGSAPPTNCG
jgi:alpha-beta hydrolase superfamily lysophospholipase